MEEKFIYIAVLVFSAILHEIMHGVTADRLGDPTAKLMGRITLNPIPHIDPIMSLLLPGLLIFMNSPIFFAAAKPVPVNPIHFREPKKDMALTALAGPLTNLALAFIAIILLKFLGPSLPLVLSIVLEAMIWVNFGLTFLNLVPIPPLDGSKVFSAFLSDRFAAQYQSISPYGFFILFALFYFTPLGSFLHYLTIFTLRLLGL